MSQYRYQSLPFQAPMLEITCAEAVPLAARQSPHVSAKALRENATDRIESSLAQI
jgi:hypothetical protein